MNPEQIERIFSDNEFFTRRATANEKGAGPGLKLCVEFLKRNGTKLEIESQKGAGSTFHFTLFKNPVAEQEKTGPVELSSFA